MNWDEVKAWLSEHLGDEGVLTHLRGIAKPEVKPEDVKAVLDTDEGRALIQPRLDSHFAKSLETWKQNNLPALVKAEHDKLYPPEDERDKQIRDLTARLDAADREKTREKLRATAIRQATERGLPIEVVDHFLGDDEAATTANLERFKGSFDAAVEAQVKARFKAGGGDDPAQSRGEGDPVDEPNPWSKATFNLTRQGQITKEDPEKAKRLKAQAVK